MEKIARQEYTNGTSRNEREHRSKNRLQEKTVIRIEFDSAASHHVKFELSETTQQT